MAAPGNRVERFYDAHPINETQILQALERRGIAPSDPAGAFVAIRRLKDAWRG
jgi:hypothetical protein